MSNHNQLESVLADQPPSPTGSSSRYPVLLDLHERRCLVVGGGTIAHRKARGLLAAGARLTVVAPRLDPGVRALDGERVALRERCYQPDDLADMHLVITCTDDPAVNAAVARDAEARGLWVNAADDPANCTFTLPAVARQGSLTITASTDGVSPALAKWLRRRFEREFDESWQAVLDLLATVRREARTRWGTSEVPGWDTALDGGLVELVQAGQHEAARSLLRRSIGLAPIGSAHERTPTWH